MTGPTDPIRVTIQHPSLPRYRVPVFRELHARPGIEIEVLYSGQPNVTNAAPDGFPARYVAGRRIGSGRGTFLWHSAQLAARREPCDVLVLSWSTRYLSLVPGLAAARRRGVGTVAWGHGVSKREAAWRAGLRSSVGRLASVLLFYSEPVAQLYRERGWPADRVFVAPNSLDQGPIRAARDRWLSDPGRLAGFGKEQGLAGGPVVLFVSRLNPANRLELLVDAAARLAPEYPGLQVVIVGGGADEADRIAALAARRQVDRHVRFVGPIYDEEALAPWFLLADAFCYPAFAGLSILHAFGYGVPVVTSDRREGHGPEIAALRDGVNGLLYRDGDGADLARQLARLFDDAELRRRLGESAQRTVDEDYDVPAMVDGMEAAIRAAAARGRRPPGAG